jgi:hypothetical protein
MEDPALLPGGVRRVDGGSMESGVVEGAKSCCQDVVAPFRLPDPGHHRRVSRLLRARMMFALDHILCTA